MNFKEISPKKITEFEIAQQNFISNQNQYRSIVAKYIIERNRAYLIAIISFIITLIAIGIVVYLATQTKVQAMIFNPNGQFIGIPNEKTKINNKAFIINQLSEYVMYLYSVPTDVNAIEHNITKIVAMTDKKYFESYIVSLIKGNLLKHKETLVTVIINSIIQLREGQWSIDFSTNIAEHKTNYKSILNYRQDLNLDDTAKIINNPLGIYVTSVETQEIMQ